jgi:hypothetical protein
VAESNNSLASEMVRSKYSLDIAMRYVAELTARCASSMTVRLKRSNRTRRLQSETKFVLVARSSKTRRIPTFGSIAWPLLCQTVYACPKQESDTL